MTGIYIYIYQIHQITDIEGILVTPTFEVTEVIIIFLTKVLGHHILKQGVHRPSTIHLHARRGEAEKF